MNVIGTRCYWLLNVSPRLAARATSSDLTFIVVRTVCGGRLYLRPLWFVAVSLTQGTFARLRARSRQAHACGESPSHRPSTAQRPLTQFAAQRHGFNGGSRLCACLGDLNERTFISSYLIYAMLFCLYPPEVLAPPRERKKRAQTATIAPTKKSF